jgi:hypothetical protein
MICDLDNTSSVRYSKPTMIKLYEYCLKPEATSVADIDQRSAVLYVAGWDCTNAHSQFVTAGRC